MVRIEPIRGPVGMGAWAHGRHGSRVVCRGHSSATVRFCRFWATLRAAGCVPQPADPSFADAKRWRSLAGDENWLRWLHASWRSWAAEEHGVRQRSVWERLAGWADDHLRQGAWLGPGIPDALPARRHGWTPYGPERFTFAARPLPPHPWVGVISSRLGRRWERQPGLLAAFRAAYAAVGKSGGTCLAADRTATAGLANAAAEVYGLNRLLFHEPRGRESTATWLRRITAMARSETSATICDVWLSPQIGLPAGGLPAGAEASPPRSDAPLRDQVLVDWSDHLYVIRMRHGGNTERLVRRRLRDRRHPPATVFLAVGDELVPADLARELIDWGAVAWNEGDSAHIPAITGQARPQVADAIEVCPVVHPPAPILTQLPAGDWPYLTHCTRAPAGPWPEQNPADYLAELLLSACPDARTAFAALHRIVSQRRLVACGGSIRRGTRVVCFTEVPLAGLAGMRTFRAHRGRWDFEPYGICLRRDWLAERGGRPVVYGDDSDWERLVAADRPYFQLRASRGRSGRCRYDWSREREWRHVGDLDLTQLPADAALLFVPTLNEARELARQSPWPIVVSPGKPLARASR